MVSVPARRVGVGSARVPPWCLFVKRKLAVRARTGQIQRALRDNHHWSYADSALRGSSFLNLPKPLQFATGNIGYHHIHHLSVRIPNYNLERAHRENPVFHSVPTLSLADGLRAVRLKLWDEQTGRLVTFAQAHARA